MTEFIGFLADAGGYTIELRNGEIYVLPKQDERRR